MKKTAVLVTFGKYRMHSVSDKIECLRNEMHLDVLESRGGVLLDEARSALATRALDGGADVTVFIDHDMDFDPFDVERLAEQARETRGLVGAPYSTRAKGGVPVSSPTPKPFSEGGPMAVRFYDGGALYPSEHAIGMGFTAIHRDAYELVAQSPLYEYVQCKEGIIRPFFQRVITPEQKWLPEDASFCWSLRRAGGATHVHTGFRVGHIGDYTFHLEDCQWQVPEVQRLDLKLKAADD